MWTLLRTWSDPEMQRKAVWVAQMMDACVDSARALNVSTEMVVAQPAQETGWGAHVMGQHNLFGIKRTPDWKGLVVYAPTFEVIGGRAVQVYDWFRDYLTFGESIADQLAFLRKNTRYEAAGVFSGGGDVAFAEGLQKGGYATDPNYAGNLLAVRATIRSYFLQYMTDLPTVGEPMPALSPPPTQRWLMIGMHGADVLELQKRLGFTDPADLDGWFGKDTRAAVMRFQASHRLADVDGIVGNQTRAALFTPQGVA